MFEQEFWRRYPEALQVSPRECIWVDELHDKHLAEEYFPIIARVPKVFNGKNRRLLDISVARFENETHHSVDRAKWGLPEPNKEAAYLSLAKYAKDVPGMSSKQVVAMNTACQWMERHFGPYMLCSRVKTQEEVVAGLDLTTSAGFPWNKKYANKREMIENMSEFSQFMQDDWDRLKSDEYVAVFGNSLKEEVRPQEKIDANSIRTFTAGPIEMTIHGNRLFEDMNERFYASHLKTASVVGFSTQYRGWDELISKLRAHPNGFALDESQYDSSLRAYLMWACAEFRWHMLRPEDQSVDNFMRLRIYYRNLVNTLIITSDGVFVLKKGGNPSGSVNTISDNTLILFILLAYGWIMNAPSDMLSLGDFEENLALALCGDDNTWTVSDKAVLFFNAKSLIGVWKEIGITTTTDSLIPRPVEELDFLSAYTVYVDGVAVPLYNRNKLLTSLLYSRYPNNPAYTLIRASAMLRVGWADKQMRDYLRELIAWLVKEYGSVLASNKDWKEALYQIPTENDLRLLFLGKQEAKMTLQMYRKRERLISDIKRVKPMNTIALPQRPKRTRRKRTVVVTQKVQGSQTAPVPKRQRRRRQRNRQNKRKRGGVMMSTRGQRSRSNFFPSGNNARGRRTCRVSEDEYIAEINGSVAFATTSYAVNPGQALTFPWLSKQAAQWEKYRFESLEFYYKPEVSAYAANGQTGKIILSLDYDAADPPPANKTQCEDTDPHVDAMPYERILLRASPREMFQNSDAKYVRPGNLPGGADIKTYDVGNLAVSTIGNASTASVGELHVRYTVVFDVPVLESTSTVPRNNQVAWFQNSAAQTLTSTVSANLLLQTATVNGLLATNASGIISLPAGNYLIYGKAVITAVSTITSAYISLQKNGVDIVAGAYLYPQSDTTLASAYISTTLSDEVYVSMNGTDTLNFLVNVTDATQVPSAAGSLVITAV